MRCSLGAIGVVLLLAASGCSISDTDDGAGLIRDAKTRYATLPTFPGATETDHSTTVGRGGGDGGGPVTSAGVLHDYRLPDTATVRAVARFYERRLTATGWRLHERLPGLPHHRAGPTLNFKTCRYSLSVNLDGGYDHALEVSLVKDAQAP